MAVVRIEKTKDYTIMGNFHFRERNMSYKAKGLLSTMLSLPDDWDYTMEGLASLSSDGIDSVRSTLKELEKFGYVEILRTRDEFGRLRGTEYIVREKSILDSPTLEKPILDSPTLEKPILENPRQLNTNILNTNISNTKESNTNGINILSGKPDDTSVSPSKCISKKPKNKKSKTHPEEVRQIIEYFNNVCGTNYKHQSKATSEMINARLNDGFTVDDFYNVIDKKHAEWSNNSDMCKYLRPETLFRPSHFESYLNQKNASSKENTNSISREMSELYNALIIE
mgnify:CR=1 FL=1